MKRDLGVAIIHYRTPELALEAVARVKSAEPEADLVVVDTDPQPEFEAALRAACPGVRFAPTPNLSYAHSVNVGLSRLDARYLAFMNADVLIEPSTFRDLRAALDEEPAAGVAGPLALTASGQPQSLGLPYARHYRALNRARRRGGGARTASVQVPWLSGCLQLVTREAWVKSGGLDEEFRFFNEDMDFCFRLRAAGYLSLLVDTPVLHVGGSSTPADAAFHVEGRRGGMIVSLRHRGPVFRAAHSLFLHVEAHLGSRLAASARAKCAHRQMLALLKSGAWFSTPFGRTLNDRRGATVGSGNEDGEPASNS